MMVVVLFACMRICTATRPLVANLNTDASASQSTGGPIGTNSHVGECTDLTAVPGGAPGRNCTGRLYLRNTPGNTAYFDFTNFDGDGLIRCVSMFLVPFRLFSTVDDDELQLT
jgi:carotenoid cleavage dioxygenase-like enzyme